MTKQLKPIIHGRDHAPDGADPIPGPSGESYPDAVLAHPCLVHYWPGDEASGDLIDRKGDWDLAPVTYGSYPQYGAAGPFAELPDLTAVANDGVGGVLGAESRFEYDFGLAPPYWSGAAEFTIEVWLYLDAYATTGAAYALYVSAGSLDSLEIYVFPHAGGSGDPGELTFVRGEASVHETTGSYFPLDSWQHVVARYDGTNIQLFRNGTLVGSLTDTTGADVTGPIGWLNNLTSSWAPWRGRSAQLAIYDCALSDADIALHFDLRDASESAAAGLVLQTDGAGGTSWTQVGAASIADEAVTPAKIEPGTDGYWLTTAAGEVVWAALPGGGGGGAPTGPAGGVLDGSYPNPGLAATVAGAGLAETADVLSVNVDGSTLEVASDTLRVKDDGITAAKIAAAAVGPSELADTAVTPGSYGDATHVGQFTVDQDGRLTAATNVAVSAGGGLPAVGAAGEVLTVVSGAWASAPPTIEVEY